MRDAGARFDDATTVREARDRFLRESGLSLAGYDAPDFPVHVGPLTLLFPNPGLLPLHDLHHIVTGYRTDLLGEAEISAFELRGGGASALVKLLCVGAIAMALVVAPRRVIRAWRRARGVRTLYTLRPSYERVLAMRVGELRALCGVPAC